MCSRLRGCGEYMLVWFWLGDMIVSWSAMERSKVLEIRLGYDNAEMSSVEPGIKC